MGLGSGSTGAHEASRGEGPEGPWNRKMSGGILGDIP